MSAVMCNWFALLVQVPGLTPYWIWDVHNMAGVVCASFMVSRILGGRKRKGGTPMVSISTSSMVIPHVRLSTIGKLGSAVTSPDTQLD